MNATELKNNLTDKDIISFMQKKYNTDYILGDNHIRFQTICHNNNLCEASYKLYYYTDTKSFYCYTSCSHIGNLYSLLEHTDGMDFASAYNYIAQFFEIDTSINVMIEGFEEDAEEEYIYKQKTIEDIENIELPIINNSNNLLKIFSNYKSVEWVKENIPVDVMEKFNIKFCTLQNKIIIPHYNQNGDLVGIRTRSLNEEDIKFFGKYTPYVLLGKKMFNHSLKHNLYGLNINKNNIVKHKKVIVVEGEKSVLQLESLLKDNIGVAITGSNFSLYQQKILLDLGVEEFIICMDKQFINVDGEDAELWYKKIYKRIEGLLNYAKVSVMWDINNLIDYKESPTDRDKKTFNYILKNRIEISKNLDYKNIIQCY